MYFKSRVKVVPMSMSGLTSTPIFFLNIAFVCFILLNTVKNFKIPDLIFRAEDYYSMIDWKEKIHEPSLTKGLLDEFLSTCIAKKASFNVGDFPCHTQSVERLI